MQGHCHSDCSRRSQIACPVELDPTRMRELLVGLPDVNVLGIDEMDDHVVVVIETRGPRPLCLGCGATPSVAPTRKPVSSTAFHEYLRRSRASA